MSEVLDQAVKLPPELEGKLFFTAKEFATIAGVSNMSVYRWHREGLLEMKQFTPKEKRVPRAEVERFLRGEMMSER